jgi:hypothetical protein
MTIRGDPFLAACLAHFDVPISGIGRTHEGIVVEIGLNQYTGRPATDQWRRILEGQAPREVAVSRPPATAEPGKGDRELLSFGIRAVICFGAMTARAAGGQTRASYFYSYNIKPATYPPADR